MSIRLKDVKKTSLRNCGEIVQINLYKKRSNGMYRFSCTWSDNKKQRYFEYKKKADRDDDYDNVIIERDFFWKRQRALVDFFLNII